MENFSIKGSKIIVADDSPTIVSKLEMFLKKQGYIVYTANDGEKCLFLAEEIDPDLIILDLDMPKIDGLQVCNKLKDNEKTNLVPIIILTASGSRDDRNMAISAGANDFLYKVYDTIELKLKVESLLKLKSAINQLENANNIIRSLAKTVEVKDKYTEGHAERVSIYASEIAEALKFRPVEIKDITMAGLLHDIGKIGVPDKILNKEGRLTDDEYDIIKQHPVVGEEICNPIKSFDKVKHIIRHHHEKLNGKGYPDGISGDEINLETRIMTIADIYDALTSDRSYRKSMDDEMAFKILYESVSKGELDGGIVEVFENIIKKKKLVFRDI